MGFLDRFGIGESDEEQSAREAVEARRAEDLRRLAQGGVPASAEQRLTELAAGTTGFTSNLSVADYALTRLHDIRPICQVMGSCVYKVGWQNMSSWSVQTGEVAVLTAAWNEARSRALGRLAEEARLADAHAVVDVTFQTRRHDFLADDIDVQVVGTAVRLPEGGRDGPPVLTDLSMPDFALLRTSGYVPVGVVTASCIYYVVPSGDSRRLTSGWQRLQPNQEIPDYTQAVYAARETVLAAATAQAAQLGAGGMVGVTVDHDVKTREVETMGGRTRHDLIVTLHVLGTGIHAYGEHRPMTPKTMVRL